MYVRLFATTLGLTLITGAATAQTVPAATAVTGAPSGEVANPDSGEIIVTAQKRAENLQKVPIVITAVSGAQLTTAGITQLSNLNTLVPGLNTRTTAGSYNPAIRGVSTSSNVVENPVALYVDGVYLPQQREGARDLPDVAQIAVLKGPQGTLFGRNATGGVIQITTRRPTKDFHFQATAGIDNYATLRGGAFVSGGLASTLTGSFSADFAEQGNGYGTNLTTGGDTFRLLHSLSLRGKLLWAPDSKTDITLIGDYLDRKDRAYSFIPYPGTAFVNPLPGPLPSVYDTYSAIDSFTAFRGGGVSLEVDRDLGFAKLVSITSYREGDTSYLFEDEPTGRPTFTVGINSGNGPNKDFTEEVQLISKGASRLTYTAGVFYFYNRYSNYPITRNFYPAFYGAPVGPPGVNQFTQTFGSEKTQSVAPYIQLAYEIFDGTHITVGGRYTYERRALEGFTFLSRYNGTTTTIPSVAAPLVIQKPTYRIALDRQFTPNVLGYVSYNRGIKSGGFNILNLANPSYAPEQLDAYEAGLKTQLFDRRLRLNAGGFYYAYNNLQVIQFVNLAQTIVNGAKARIYGVDVDFTAKVSDQFTLSGGLEALHANFTSYNNAVGSIPKPAGGATLISINATGNRVPLSQEFTGTLAADFDQSVSFGTLHYNLTANYNGDYTFEPDSFLRQKAYTLVNTSLTWKSNSDRLSVSVWGRNLADEHILNNASSQAVGYPVSYGQSPRTFGITGKVAY